MIKYIRRLGALPFLAFLTLVHWTTLWVHSLWLFMKHGGEWVQYDKEFNRDSVQTIIKEALAKEVL